MAKLDLSRLLSGFAGAELIETSTGRVVSVPRDAYRDLCRALRDEGCELSSVTAVDRAEELEVVAHLLLSPSEQLTVKTAVPLGDPKVDSLCPVWAGAEWQEREAYDMYGIEFVDHPDMTRILLDDNFEGFPLRKSFELEEVAW